MEKKCPEVVKIDTAYKFHLSDGNINTFVVQWFILGYS